MKQCPKCKRTYPDDSLNFCLDDGILLSSVDDPDATWVSPKSKLATATELPNTPPKSQSRSSVLPGLLVVVLALIVGGGAVAYFMSGTKSGTSASNSSPNPSSPAPAKPAKQPAARSNSQPVTSTPNCMISYPAGSCWTITPPKGTGCSGLPLPNPAVAVTPDGSTCTLTVPANADHGVACENGGRELHLQQGDEFEIEASGLVGFSADHPCVNPEGMRGWYDPYVDGPFKQNVGGLEFSIDSFQSSRYFAGTYYRSHATVGGVPTFRIVERSTGFHDNNQGAFNVTIRKL